MTIPGADGNKTLFDQVHAWTFSEAGAISDSAHFRNKWQASKLSLRIAMRAAKRFILDDDFVRAAVKQASVQPAKMLNLCHLANLPFEKCWFEYDNNVRVDAQHELGTGKERDEDLGIAGFLMERLDAANPTAYRICHTGYVQEGESRGGIDRNSAIAPSSYVIDSSGLLPYLHKKEFTHLPDLPADRVATMERHMRGMGWGYFDNDQIKQGVHIDNLNYAVSEELMRRGGVCIEPRFFSSVAEYAVRLDLGKGKGVRAAGDAALQYFMGDIIEGRGNLRFYTAILAMINTCPIEYRHRPARGFLRQRLRNVPYLESQTVRIDCSKTRTVLVVDRAIKDAIGQRHNKAHDVRGHWALAEYAHGGRACRHEPVERDGRYALCGKCAKLIVWRDHYQRGDARLGFVNHSYEVT